jgi:ribonucleoside-diphosphate reductase alpha chain
MKDIEALKWLNNNELSYNIWDKKYRVNGESFEDWLLRIANCDPKVMKLIAEKKFIFGGRILASRGVTDRKVTYSNCYVIEPPEDNLESIFECGKKLARTYSYGGGCGTDVSKLAPRGARIHNAAKSTSGATSFMDFFSYITGLIGQEGRRGALMLSMTCEHPDIMEFINLKSDLNICTKANISVRVTDEFMKAVKEDKYWICSFYRPESGETITKTYKAKELFHLLAKRNWEMAEPGILYWDNICGYNLLDKHKDFQYAGVNPCKPMCRA